MRRLHLLLLLLLAFVELWSLAKAGSGADNDKVRSSQTCAANDAQCHDEKSQQQPQQRIKKASPTADQELVALR